jgi:cyclin H
VARSAGSLSSALKLSEHSRYFIYLQTLPDAAAEVTQKLYDAALNLVRASRLTDAELIYTPSQIALACLSSCSPSLATAWAKSKVSADSPAYAALQHTLESIKAIITHDGHPPDVESVRVVDRRLKLCKNPEKVVGSSVYLAKKAEEERKADEKRTRKAEEARRALEEGDPFGEVLKPPETRPVDDDDDDD